MPTWGPLANEGFKDRRLKAVYFFAGQAKSGGNDPVGAVPADGEPTLKNDMYYTVWPEDDRRSAPADHARHRVRRWHAGQRIAGVRILG